MLAKELHCITAILIPVLCMWLSFISHASELTSQNTTKTNQQSEQLENRSFVARVSGTSSALVNTTSEQIRLATGEGYYPYVSQRLPQGGWSQALVVGTFLEMGHKVDIHTLPWGRGQMWTEEKRFLGTFPYVYSAQRAEKFFFSTAINYISVRFYVAKTSNITDIQQLKNKRLCLPFGYSDDFAHDGVVDKLNLKINRVLDGAACIGHVQRGWSDAGLTNRYVSLNEVNNNRLIDSELRVLPTDLEKVNLHFIISKSYPDGQTWMERFNRAFSTLTKDGRKASIDQKFEQLITPQ
ncbi:transporter substrate-binding domain-containing protein [Paraglaciecola sp. 20A4]|uniref:substrate-binding periplasmic protein n=1 Tax=Paraglaciecola sp. 20A4 TaxID=2687288 RepID=UPI00140A4883|nr:transporter substrate-binding domain-containing protein [Paraglaciecola sp. 20A4]